MKKMKRNKKHKSFLKKIRIRYFFRRKIKYKKIERRNWSESRLVFKNEFLRETNPIQGNYRVLGLVDINSDINDENSRQTPVDKIEEV